MSTDLSALTGHLHLNNLLTPVLVYPAGTPFFRGSGVPDGHWNPAPLEKRRRLKQRCDAPRGHEHKYAMLYLAIDEVTVEYELRRLSEESGVMVRTHQPDREQTIARHTSRKPLAFVDADSPMLQHGFPYRLPGGHDEIEQWQQLSLAIHEAAEMHQGPLAVPIAGLTYRSRMRGCAGRVFAMFDRHRDQALLRGIPEPFASPLREDAGLGMPVHNLQFARVR